MALDRDTQRVHCWLSCTCGGYYDLPVNTTPPPVLRCYYHGRDERVISYAPAAEMTHHLVDAVVEEKMAAFLGVAERCGISLYDWQRRIVEGWIREGSIKL